MSGRISILDSISLITKNWKTSLMIVLFDLLFILLIFNNWSANFNSWIYNLILNSKALIQWLVSVPVLLIEALILVFLYSFLKYCTVHFVQNFFKKKKFSLENYWRFTKINLIAILAIAYVVIIYVLLTTIIFDTVLEGNIYNQSKVMSVLIIGILLGVIFLLYSYTLLNLLHFIFLKEKKLKKVIKEAFSKSIILKTYKLYLPNLIVLLIPIGLLLVGSVLAIIAWFGYPLYLNSYKPFLMILSFLTFYFILLLNRLNFYLLCEK